MASNFPATAIDSFTTKVDGTDYPAAAHINDLQNAVVAVQTKVGVDSSAVTTSHDYKLSGITSSDKAVSKTGTETLTNKTLTSPVLNTGVSGTAVLDEDNMASNSATKLATQQSIKAYVDSGTVTMTNKTLTSPVLNTGISGTAFLDEDTMVSNSATKVCSQQSIKAYVDAAITTAKAALYPIGSIYFATVSTNPGTLLGFGTWTAWGAGRVPVGINASDTDFDTVEETGGTKTHTLTSDEMPIHTHTQNAHSHGAPSGTTHFWAYDTTANENYTQFGSGTHSAVKTATASATATNNNTGGGAAHNNLQPYIVCYMWKRTA